MSISFYPATILENHVKSTIPNSWSNYYLDDDKAYDIYRDDEPPLNPEYNPAADMNLSNSNAAGFLLSVLEVPSADLTCGTIEIDKAEGLCLAWQCFHEPWHQGWAPGHPISEERANTRYSERLLAMIQLGRTTNATHIAWA